MYQLKVILYTIPFNILLNDYGEREKDWQKYKTIQIKDLHFILEKAS